MEVAVKKKTTHPPTSEMVETALKHLDNRRGTSFYAIKQFVFSMYNVDPVRITPFIKRFLETAVSQGAVVRTKGTGLAGSFRLAKANPTAPKVKSATVVKKPIPKKTPANEKKPKTSPKKPKTASNVKVQKSTSDVKPATSVTASKTKKRKISITVTKVRKATTKTAKR